MKLETKRSLMYRKANGLMDRKKERKTNPEPEQIQATEGITETTEMPAALKSFKERNTAERQRFNDATDSECFVAITFASRSEKDAFIAEFGLIKHPLIPGTPGNKYVNGRSLAVALRSLLSKAIGQ